MNNWHVKLLALGLIALGTVICAYKVIWLGLPLFPAGKADVWTIEARVAFKGKKEPAKATLRIPQHVTGFTVVDERFVSGKYGLDTHVDGWNRKAEWAVREAQGEQALYYRLQIADDTRQTDNLPNTSPPSINPPNLPEAIQSAANALLDEARSKSADGETLARELIRRFNDPHPDSNIQTLLADVSAPDLKVRRILQLLALGGVPARQAAVLVFHKGMNHGTLKTWLQVHDGRQWQTFNPTTALVGLPRHALVWMVGDGPLFTVDGGKHPTVEFSVTKHAREMIVVAARRARELNSQLIEYSLFSLPVQAQNVYRVLLMVPVGALLIVLLRNVIGFKTFGTFMPILIALSFRETGITWGVSLLVLLVALGLLMRSYLEYLKLLLVPRLASVLTIVILLMVMISLFSHKLGLDQGLYVAMFPMVIMAMTIERMSLVWEEHGPVEALQQGLGSLTVAVLAHLVLSNRALEHLVFVFPELLLVVLALMLLLGRYTGYRLTELWRFRNVIRGATP